MNIYYKLITPFKSKETNKYNYVYQITEISTGKKYIGSRGSTTEPNKDIKKYKSSSTNKQFKKNQKLNPLNYWYEILSHHETREDAVLEEARIHELYNVGCSDNYFNKSNQTRNGFITPGVINVRDCNGITLRVSTDDPKFLDGSLVHTNTGKVTTKNASGITMQVSTTDPRFLNGSLVGVNAGTTNVFDDQGNIIKISVTDPRFLSGELKSITTGTVSARDCNGNTVKVLKDDPRLSSGELTGVNVGRVTVVDELGNTMQVLRSDSRYVSGELKSVTLGKVMVRDTDGNTMQVSTDDPRYVSGELFHVGKGLTNVKGKDNVIFKTSVDDPRIKSGELVGAALKWLMINGDVISAIKAAEKYNISRSTISSRVKSTNPKWSEWKYA